jgi:hypothetical protein
MSWVITGSEKTPVDLNRSQVSLLLHGDGTSGSTTITDSSPTLKTPTVVANAQISTAQSKFGGSSILCSIVSSIQYAGFQALGPSDWTIEFFAYRTSGDGVRALLDTRNSDSNSQGLLIYLAAANITVFWSGANRLAGTTLTLNQWQHVAVTKSGNNVRLFQDGALQATTTQPFDGTSATTRITSVFNIGSWGFDGYLDEYRITKGVARYTANFTPPTAAFPDI